MSIKFRKTACLASIILMLGFVSSCGDDAITCASTAVETAASHNHADSTTYSSATTYADALATGITPADHTHDVTLTASDVTGMNAGPIDVTSSSAVAHTHTVSISCN